MNSKLQQKQPTLQKQKYIQTAIVLFKRWPKGMVYGSNRRSDGFPHIRDSVDGQRFLLIQLLALLPTCCSALWFFRWHAAAMIAVSVFCAGFVEVVAAIYRNRDIDGGFFISGLLFGLILPPALPLWLVAVGCLFGQFFGKEVFGGMRYAIFNPALVGRLFITVSFPVVIASSYLVQMPDAVTAATPLAALKGSTNPVPYQQLLLGTAPGCIGEVFRLGIIIGGLLLIVTRAINWRIPICFIAVFAALNGIGHWLLPGSFGPTLYSLLCGGLLFGAFFLATDAPTTPMTNAGKYIFASGAAILTLLIRSFSVHGEGVMYAIILMSAGAPLIDAAVLRFHYRSSAA
ncbi:MAG: RnfABCDGE type electron transport complex subunit D [Chitinivibrionales bacterium]|nr:RnfABCDGE type electron transport complex subunit D [Chitinivibrionales bacterium]